MIVLQTQTINRRRTPTKLSNSRSDPPEVATSKTPGPNSPAEMRAPLTLAGPPAERKWRPAHKRNESLTSPSDFLIYSDTSTQQNHTSNKSMSPERERELATLCDRTSELNLDLRMDARHFYLLNHNNNNDKNIETNTNNHGIDRNKGQNNGQDNSQPRLPTTTGKKLARPKFKLKWLLAKSLGSLGVASSSSWLVPLLLLGFLVAVCWCHSAQTFASAFVINVQTKQHAHRPRPHPGHHHLNDLHSQQSLRRSPNYLIVSSPSTSTPTSNSTSHRWKRASEQKLERSAKLLEIDALNYLHRYGYMNSSGSSSPSAASSSSNAINLISEESFHEAVMQFQRFAGIPETGSVDGLTVKFMQMPRCGNKDMAGKGENGKRRRRRRKRYALQGSKWRRQELTYRISQYPSRFSNKRHEVDGQIERAFKIWSQVAPIDFVVKREGRVHIDIRFASGEHGDGDPFDGPGNTLAHAYFPQYGGDAHFDDQEYWTVDSYTGTNIFQVAAHELGHSLGLGHSSVREALMAPFYQKYKPNFKLHADDVLAIQALYGERGNGADDSPDDSPRPSTTTSTTTESSVPRRRPADSDEGGGFFAPKPVDLCQDAQVDAITRTEDGSTYVFRGQHYWQIKNEGLAGAAGKISRDWEGLPGNLDAALTWSDGKTFFFKGDKYWRYFNKHREPGYPKLISVGFAGIPNNLDAAFVWSGNGKTYFFKRDKYWRFDSKQEPPVSGQYPKPLKNWVGLPASGVDGAFKWENGMTYFFKDDLYYRFDDREFEVDSAAKPAFPRSTAEWWFGCTNSNLPIRRQPSDDTPGGSGGSGDGAMARNAATGSLSRPTNDIEPSESSQSPGAALATSSLHFHRRPSLTYETAPAASGNSGGGRAGSISRSIISSLSALFPTSGGSSSSSSTSTFGSSSNSDSNSDQPGDWSFHRGLGEEVRRLMKGSRSLGGGGSSSSSFSSSSSDKDNARWSFPLSAGSSQSGGSNNRHQMASGRDQANQHVSRGGEESLSELRLLPSSSSSSTLDNKKEEEEERASSVVT